MNIGFTGTRYGMTTDQKKMVKAFLEEWKPEQFHHGDCVGADAEAHQIALDLNIDIYVHPPTIDEFRAFTKDWKKRFQARSYLSRNHAIVDASNYILAAPFEETEQLHGGTWHAVRWARHSEKPVRIFYP